MNHILHATSISKSYDDKKALDDVSITLRKGEFLSLLGPSGSGKTTLLSVISGLTKADSGELVLSGRRIDDLPPFRRDIGVVFQNYALFPHLTVYQNIAFPLEMRGVSSTLVKEKVGKVLEMVRLGEHAKKRPKQLSGGQQQRVALARAIVFEPPLLLMDEPLSALDKNLRMSVQLEIMSLHRNIGASIIYVTHDQDEAVVMSDRIALFNDGRVEQIGSPMDLYERPQSHFVASFVGETNFVRGTVKEVGEGCCTIEGPGGRLLRARLAKSLVPGSAAVLSVRPEHVRAVKQETDKPSENHLAGTVAQSIYLGRGRKLVVTVPGGGTVMILAGTNEPYKPGDAIDLSWSSDDAIALAAPA